MDMTIIPLSPEQLAAMVKPAGINPDRFAGVVVPASWFCTIHQISYPTLIRWIEELKTSN
jgi:hypothetical protein